MAIVLVHAYEMRQYVPRTTSLPRPSALSLPLGRTVVSTSTFTFRMHQGSLHCHSLCAVQYVRNRGRRSRSGCDTTDPSVDGILCERDRSDAVSGQK
jgi:hypothetical protein